MLLIMHFSVSTHLDVYKIVEITIWEVLTLDNILLNTITNIHYMLLIMHYSVSTHTDVYKKLETKI